MSIMSPKEAARWPHMSLERTRVPDLSIGATVLIAAIALPFFVFTRAEHLHRASARNAVAATVTTRSPEVLPTNDPTTVTASSPPATAVPLAAASPTPRARPSKTAMPTPTPTPTSTPTPTPTSTPPPGPDLPPVAVLALNPNSGTAPLTVIANASGSTDTDQTPITQIFFDFGDASSAVRANSLNQAPHTYASPGTYIVTVSVIDTAKNASTQTKSVVVS